MTKQICITGTQTFHACYVNFYFAYRTSSVLRQWFFLPKHCQKSKSLGLFRKGKIRIKAKFHISDLVIWGHSREGNPVL